MSSSIVLLKLEDGRAHYPIWRRAMIGIAARLSTEGLLGYLLSPAEYAVHYPAAPDFAPLAHYGEEPDLLPAGTHTNWLARKQAYEKEKKELDNLSLAIISSLSAMAHVHIDTDILGLGHTPIRTILARLDAHFEQTSPMELTAARAPLEAAFRHGETPLATHLCTHLTTHNVLLRQGYALTEPEKVRLLRNSVSCQPSIAVFEHALGMFDMANPTVASQTFAKLSAVLTAADDRLATTALSAGYAPASSAAAAQRPRQAPRPRAPAVTKHTCYTHGPGSHDTKDCFRPCAAHLLLPGYKVQPRPKDG